MTALVKYEAAKQALAECKSRDEVKDWIDKTAAMQAYARMAKDHGLEIDAAEIRIRAERRLGVLINAEKENGGLNKGGRPEKTPHQKVGVSETPHQKVGVFKTPPQEAQVPRPKLADAGIDYNLSSRAQKLAHVPEQQFEGEIKEWRQRVKNEGARVTARLLTAGTKVEKRDRVAELEAENEQLKDEIEQVREGAKEAVAAAEAAQAMLRTEPGKLVLKLQAEVTRLTNERDRYMNQVGQMAAQIKSLQRKLARYE